MRPLLLFLLAFSVLDCAASPEAPPPALAPDTVWQRAETVSFEQNHPGLGVSHRYQSRIGWVDVYVYSLRRTWQSGVRDPLFPEHFDSSLHDVRAHAQRGIYAELEVGAVKDLTIGGQAFRSVNLLYSLEGRPLRSALYLTARNGQLLKYRISVSAAEADLDAVAQHFIEDNLRADPTAKVVSRPEGAIFARVGGP